MVAAKKPTTGASKKRPAASLKKKTSTRVLTGDLLKQAKIAVQHKSIILGTTRVKTKEGGTKSRNWFGRITMDKNDIPHVKKGRRTQGAVYAAFDDALDKRSRKLLCSAQAKKVAVKIDKMKIGATLSEALRHLGVKPLAPPKTACKKKKKPAAKKTKKAAAKKPAAKKTSGSSKKPAAKKTSGSSKKPAAKKTSGSRSSSKKTSGSRSSSSKKTSGSRSSSKKTSGSRSSSKK
jgi:hypothetical protein